MKITSCPNTAAATWVGEAYNSFLPLLLSLDNAIIAPQFLSLL